MTTSTTIRKSYGNRKLNSYSEDYPLRLVRPKSTTSIPKKSEDVAKLIKYIDDNIIGKNNAFLGPFGRRKVVFCDYVSAGRSLQFIEEYILREVLPCYGNTDTTISITALQSTLFRQEAREIIRNAVNGGENDAVIFTGNGVVDALRKLIELLDFQEPPVVFVGPSEQRMKEQLWREYGAKVVRIAETKEGFLDLKDLEEQLRLHRVTGRPMIGCFLATSNVTGILTDDIASTLLLHQYGAYSFWDYGHAAPYITLDMNPVVPRVEERAIYKDAIYFSGHKFVGGVQTPGILVVKKYLFAKEKTGQQNNVDVHSLELQEEGDSVAVVESVRAGLVMQLKETMTVANIMQRQEKITKQMLQHIRNIPELILLGNASTSVKRLPVFSFMVRHPRATFLHHNFVCAVLNDVFGIQARGGLSCDTAYAQDLLGIKEALANQYENIYLENVRLNTLNLCHQSHYELLQPGYARISLPYFMSDAELAFVMEALKMVATEGWKLLPQYVVDPETGEWRHHTNSVSKDRKWLGSIRYVDGKMTMNERRISGPGLFPQNYSECLQTARNLFNRSRKTVHRNPCPDQGIHFDERSDKLRWFMLPHEAQDMLLKNSQNVKHNVPFDPVTYSGSRRTIPEKRDVDIITMSAPISNNSSPKHYGLSAVDERFMSCVSPVPYFIQDFNMVYNQHQQPSPIPVSFAVGEVVNTAAFGMPGQQPVFQRDRCHSLGTNNLASPVLSPQTRVSLESDGNTSPTLLSAAAAAEEQQHNDNLQAYVKEMTKELATNIKSEIREVISKVEDVLESTDSIDVSNLSFHSDRHGSGSDDGRSDSISANEVAEYLEKVSKEMANEVKCEIRDVVSAVDVFIAPDNQDKHCCYSRSSSDGEKTNNNNNNNNNTGAIPRTTVKHTPGSSSETVINVKAMSSSPALLSDEEEKCSNKHNMFGSTVSSQDSGINLSFLEGESLSSEFGKQRSSSESSAGRNLRKNHAAAAEKLKFSTLQRQNCKSQFSEASVDDSSDCSWSATPETNAKWTSPPKNIWQPTVEAIQEYEMIKNGDKVMVCLSGGKDSLSLLHTLLQYQWTVRAKGVTFGIGAITVDPDCSWCDPCDLVPHLKALGVHYLVDGQSDDESELKEQRLVPPGQENVFSFCNSEKRKRLYAAAKGCGYNVLAIGQHLDDLSESFLLSLFHSGELKTMKAHYYIREHNLRVIRPFVYVREKYLRQFVQAQNLPAIFDNARSTGVETPKERHRTKQLLAQQEILFPKLFCSLKAAMQPLMTFQTKEELVKYRRRTKKENSSSSAGAAAAEQHQQKAAQIIDTGDTEEEATFNLTE